MLCSCGYLELMYYGVAMNQTDLYTKYKYLIDTILGFMCYKLSYLLTSQTSCSHDSRHQLRVYSERRIIRGSLQ